MRQGPWTAEQINDILRGYQAACVIMAAGELELFDRMGSGPFTAAEATRRPARKPHAHCSRTRRSLSISSARQYSSLRSTRFSTTQNSHCGR